MDSQSPTIPIWRTAAAAYRSGVGALFSHGALFRYFIYASLLCVVLLGIQVYQLRSSFASIVEEQTPGTIVQRIALSMLLFVGYATATCPYAVAVHRKVLLGEVPRAYYVASLFQRRQLRFLLASITISALFFLAPFINNLAVYLIYGLNPFDGRAVTLAYRMRPGMALMVTILTWLSYALAALIAARFTFAFPAIAIEAAGASLRRSVADTHGSTWRLFFLFVLVFALPFALFLTASVAAAVTFVASNPDFARSPERMAAAMSSSPTFYAVYVIVFVLTMVMVAVTAAAAARAYETRVGRHHTGVADVFD